MQAVYVIVGVGLYIVFQDSTQSDVLLNFSKGALGPIVGDVAAEVITYAVWLGYAFNLIVTYPMINWGLREVSCYQSQGTTESFLFASRQPLLPLGCWLLLLLCRCGLVVQVINEIAFGSPEVSNLPWAIVTIAILVITYAIAMVVPNIWPVMVRYMPACLPISTKTCLTCKESL